MRTILAVFYSQSGQSKRALTTFVGSLPSFNTLQFRYIDLSEGQATKDRYRMPWKFFDFVRAQPEALNGGSEAEPFKARILGDFDAMLICYPVWFLSPATPVSDFLRSLPEGSLNGKNVVTIATCRNMWVEAQISLREQIERLGGRVMSHVVMEDSAPTYATLVTTPRFFLTGKRTFHCKLLNRWFPPFGIRESAYFALAKWVSCQADLFSTPSNWFRADQSLILSESVGRWISKTLYLGWPLVRKCNGFVQSLYLIWVVVMTMLLILILMAPAVALSKLPPVKRALVRVQQRCVSNVTA